MTTFQADGQTRSGYLALPKGGPETAISVMEALGLAEAEHNPKNNRMRAL